MCQRLMDSGMVAGSMTQEWKRPRPQRYPVLRLGDRLNGTRPTADGLGDGDAVPEIVLAVA